MKVMFDYMPNYSCEVLKMSGITYDTDPAAKAMKLDVKARFLDVHHLTFEYFAYWFTLVFT